MEEVPVRKSRWWRRRGKTQDNLRDDHDQTATARCENIILCKQYVWSAAHPLPLGHQRSLYAKTVLSPFSSISNKVQNYPFIPCVSSPQKRLFGTKISTKGSSEHLGWGGASIHSGYSLAGKMKTHSASAVFMGSSTISSHSVAAS